MMITKAQLQISRNLCGLARLSNEEREALQALIAVGEKLTNGTHELIEKRALPWISALDLGKTESFGACTCGKHHQEVNECEKLGCPYRAMIAAAK